MSYLVLRVSISAHIILIALALHGIHRGIAWVLCKFFIASEPFLAILLHSLIVLFFYIRSKAKEKYNNASNENQIQKRIFRSIHRCLDLVTLGTFSFQLYFWIIFLKACIYVTFHIEKVIVGAMLRNLIDFLRHPIKSN